MAVEWGPSRPSPSRRCRFFVVSTLDIRIRSGWLKRCAFYVNMKVITCSAVQRHVEGDISRTYGWAGSAWKPSANLIKSLFKSAPTRIYQRCSLQFIWTVKKWVSTLKWKVWRLGVDSAYFGSLGRPLVAKKAVNFLPAKKAVNSQIYCLLRPDNPELITRYCNLWTAQENPPRVQEKTLVKMSHHCDPSSTPQTSNAGSFQKEFPKSSGELCDRVQVLKSGIRASTRPIFPNDFR